MPSNNTTTFGQLPPKAVANEDIFAVQAADGLNYRFTAQELGVFIGGGVGLTSLNGDATAAQIIAGTTNRVSIGDAGATHTIDIDAAYVGQTSITTLGTITNGAWNGTNIPYSKLDLALGILNTDISNSAAIAFSKLAALTSGRILVGSVGNVATSVVMSGDVTIAAGGATEIGATKVTNGMLAGSIAAAKLIGTDIDTVGTITTGTWNADTIAINKGGTGQITALLAINALTAVAGATIGHVLTKSAGGDAVFEAPTGSSSPLTTKGDLYTFTSVDARLPVGTNGQLLSADSAEATGLKWIAAGGGGDMILAAAQTVTGAKTFGTIGGAVGKFILAGSISGSTIVNAAAIAGSTTITFPGTTGTVALTSDLTGFFDTAGTGLTSSGSTVNVIGTASRIVANANSIDIDAAYVGQASITTVGTITTGTWNGVDIALANITDIATASFLGRTTAATGVIEVLTATQSTAMLNNFTDALKGLVPLSGGGTTNYLRADGTWAEPPGTGGASPLTTKGDLYTFTSVDARLGVGADDTVLIADDTEATGLKYGFLANINIDASAAIAYSKLATLASGNILVGSVGGVATSVAMAGDVTIIAAGTTAIGALKVTNAMLAGSIAAAKLIGTDITTVGTIGTGTWEGTAVASAFLDADTMHLSVVQNVTGAKDFDDGKLILNGVTSGTTTLKAAAIAGTTIATFPDSTGTVAYKTGIDSPKQSFIIAISDETTAITLGTSKVKFRMPAAFTVTEVRASLSTASSSGLPTFDINESGSTILSTKITIDVSETTSTTAATPPVISDASLADDAEITIDIDVAGTGAAGAKIEIIGYYT